MIIQELYAYYQRLRNEKPLIIPPPGYSVEKIHFALEINENGEITRVMDLRESDGKKAYPKLVIVPTLEETRTNKIIPNFLWDNSKYVLGIDKMDKNATQSVKIKKEKRALECFEAFKKRHEKFGEICSDEGLKALVDFLKKWTPDKIENLNYKDELPGSNIVFKLEKDKRIFLHERQELKELWESKRSSWEYQDLSKEWISQCLVTGEKKPIALTHPSIKGVQGAQSSGAAIVSFNISSFTSYDKEQSYNAPIGKDAVFAYTTALNYLLRRESHQKIRIGDATTVFWSERETPLEDFLGNLLDPESTSEEDNKKIYDFLDSVRNGRRIEPIDPDIKFYILGISPNASRLSIRFWYASTVGDIVRNLNDHYSDMEIVRNFPDKESRYPSIWRLLLETAPLKKIENVNPLLAGAFTRSILSGELYPQEILSAALERIRVDGDMNYYRASLIKGYLSRSRRKRKLRWEVKMGLNTELTDVGYRLGRLFAVLEKAQEEANPGINATIKDRYFSSASATPAAVFSQLIRLSQHHLSKLDGGRKTNIEKLIQEILSDVERFPAHLNLEEQGMFALGYYQQRKALFTKKEDQIDE
jgi:CRISPR-associated protein Csd1